MKIVCTKSKKFKGVQVTDQEFVTLKQLVNNSSCLSVAQKNVQEHFKVSEPLAFKLAQAVLYNFKWLKVIHPDELLEENLQKPEVKEKIDDLFDRMNILYDSVINK